LNKKRRLKIKNLEKRIEHFKTINRIMISNNQKYYLEKEWFDDVILLSKRDIENEISKTRLEIKNVKSSSRLELFLQLFHR